jgi:hypothetical protein
MLPDVRPPFREYAPPEQAPLAGYAAALLVYGIALSLALGIARRRRAQPHLADVALLGVATHKLARLISKDFVAAPLRARLPAGNNPRARPRYTMSPAAVRSARRWATYSRVHTASMSGSRLA